MKVKNESSSIYSPFFQRKITTTSPLGEDAQIERELTRRKVVMDDAKWEQVIQMLRASNLHTHAAVQQALNGRIMPNIAQEIKKEKDLEYNSEENASEEEKRIIEETGWFNGILGKRIIGRGRYGDDDKWKNDLGDGSSNAMINENTKVENDNSRGIFKKQNSFSNLAGLDSKPKGILKAPLPASIDSSKRTLSLLSLQDCDDQSNIPTKQQSIPLHEINDYDVPQTHRVQSQLFNDENKKLLKRQVRPQDPPCSEDNDKGRRFYSRSNSISSISSFLGVKNEKDTTQIDEDDSSDNEKSISNRFNFFSKTSVRKKSIGNENDNDTETKKLTHPDMYGSQSINNDTFFVFDQFDEEEYNYHSKEDISMNFNVSFKQNDHHKDNIKGKSIAEKPQLLPHHSIRRIQELTGTKSTGSWIKMQERMLKKKDSREIKSESNSINESNYVEEKSEHSNENVLDVMQSAFINKDPSSKIGNSRESQQKKITAHANNEINDEKFAQTTISNDTKTIEEDEVHPDKSESANSILDVNHQSEKSELTKSVLDANNHSDKPELINTISCTNDHSDESEITRITNNVIDDCCNPDKSDKSEVTKETISTKNSPQVSSIEGEFFDEGWRLRDSAQPEDDDSVSTDSNTSLAKNDALGLKSGKMSNTSNFRYDSILNSVNNKIFVESYDRKQISGFFPQATEFASESKNDEKDSDQLSQENDSYDKKKKNGKITNALRKFSLTSQTNVNEENINIQKIEKNILEFNTYNKNYQNKSEDINVSKAPYNPLSKDWLDRDTKNDGKLTEAIRRRLDPKYTRDKSKGKKRTKSRSNDARKKDKPSILKRSSFNEDESEVMKSNDKKIVNGFRKFSLEGTLSPRSSLSKKNKKQTTRTSKSNNNEPNTATKFIDSTNISASQRQRMTIVRKNSIDMMFDTLNNNPDNASNNKNEKKISFAPLSRKRKGEISRDKFKRFSLGSAMSSKKTDDSLESGRRTTMPADNVLRTFHGRKQMTFMNEKDSIMDKLSILSKPDYDPKKYSSHDQINLMALANIDICSETGAEIHNNDEEISTITTYSRVSSLEYCRGNSTRLKETLFSSEDIAESQGKKAHDVKLDASQYLNEMSKQHSARSLFSRSPN